MLPIDPILPDLTATLAREGRAVLQAPPGAGKTTRVPLALRDTHPGKIVMLEPRRLAARAAAERLAEQLGERPGGQVGYRMRGDNKPGSRIDVVTEGILTRMLQSDPELTGVGTVIFDEFHERSLNADLGLALTLEVRAALRPDLRLLVMSATLDAAPVAALMHDAPVLTSAGRAYPVDLRPLPRPLPRGARLAPAMADLIVQAATETEGGILAFLPGEGEIRQTARLLQGRLPGAVIRPLFGALPFSDQRAAIRPETGGRKVVLSTSIAETSLTIEDIRVVVDSGRARRAMFDPNSGMSRLVTVPASRAETTQRAGRAGRVAPGVCYQLWAAAEAGALPAHAPPEIAVADLTGLALELAQWGADDLPFLTPPPEGALAEARSLLEDLGALRGGTITAHGRAMAALPLHPRLAHMLITGGGADLAALLSDRDPLRGAGADLALRLKALRGRHDGPGEASPGALKRLRVETVRLARLAPDAPGFSDAQRAALAYPDRIGLRRRGDDPRWLLSGGRGARMEPADPMAADRLIVATELDGAGVEARIRQAIRLEEADLRAVMPDRIHWVDTCTWSRREGRVIARREERLGALVLDHRNWDAPPEVLARAMLEGVRQIGLLPSPAAERFRARVTLARGADPDLPAMDDATLLAQAGEWLLPYLTGLRSRADWKAFDLLPALKSRLTWAQSQSLAALVPAQFTTPLGRDVPIDYSGEAPAIAVRLQEMFGVTTHPSVAGRALQITLLSPAQRPVQVTQDLPGFWDSSYADVRKDMRGRYPKHPWPEDPRAADPTLRAKPRGRG